MVYDTRFIKGSKLVANARARVLHLIDSEGVYGAERVILNLSKEMLNSDNFEPVVGCIVKSSNDRNDLFDAAVSMGIEAIKVPISNRNVFFDLFRAAKLLRLKRIAIVHSHGYKPSVYAGFLRLIFNMPAVATCHLWFDPSSGPLKMRFMMWLEKYAYKSFSKVLAVSEAISRILLQNSIDPRRVQVIPNGVDVADGTVSDASVELLRQELGLSEQCRCILNAGRLARQKSQWVIIEAAAIVKSAGVSFQILIVGEGGLKDSLQHLIEQRNVEDCVKLLGFRTDIAQLLRVADIFVLPSLDEGMPMSLLEAVNSKVPVIATAVGDIPKLLEHERSGLIVAQENPSMLAEQILQLLNNKPQAQAMAQVAFDRARKLYSSQAMSKRYLDVYAEVLA